MRLLRALVAPAMPRVSKPIIDGVVAWITRHSGKLAGIRKRHSKARYFRTSWTAPGARRRAGWRRCLQGSEFRHAGVAYAGGGRMVIQNIRFTIHQYEKEALIGSDRVEKRPTEGQIPLDGIDLRE